ncbi:MAG: glycosyltransferase family 9 protein [Chitinophagaceae bacterium]
MKILVRLPNWLGDMVMSIGFINALYSVYPGATVGVIVKKGLEGLIEFFPETAAVFIFSKDEFPGILGAWRFGTTIRRQGRYDLFFSLPDSFSSALIGFASGSRKRIGYGNEGRSLLLTYPVKKKGFSHRVTEYTNLLASYSQRTVDSEKIYIRLHHSPNIDQIVFNINSEASSRRLPIKKAIDLVTCIREKYESRIVLIGGKNDRNYTEELFLRLPSSNNIVNLAGKTTLAQLIELMASSRVVVTTDSGPAHLANATGTHTVVLFGAGNELNTAPFNTDNLSIIRFGQLPCEPCRKNTCVLYGIPKCLEMLEEKLVVEMMMKGFYSDE